MSQHEGVSCDACLLGNFRGRRYKCLICYDYDLCSSCYESGAATTHHSSTHAMQCILTRSDHELFYAGESSLTGLSDAHLVHSYTCPFCAKPGFTEATLVEHVTSQHADAPTDVVCPICASLQGGDPNHVTSDFSVHLTLEHRSGGSGGGGGASNHQTSGGNGPRDLISFLDEPGGGGGTGSSERTPRGPSGVRRVGRGALGSASTARARRGINLHNPNNPPPPPALSNLAFSDPGAAAAAVAAASSGASREAADPIAELLSQLSGVRRSASSSSSSSRLQQLQMQLQYAAASTQHHAATSRQERRLARQGATRSRPGFSSSTLSSNAVGPSSNNLNSNSGVQVVAGFVPSVTGSQFAQQLPPQFTATSSTAETRTMHHHHHPQYHQQAPQNLSGAGGSESSSATSVGGGGGLFGLAGLAGALPSKDGPYAGAGNSGFLLRQLSGEESDENTRAEAVLAKSKKSHFVQELVLSTLINRKGGDPQGVGSGAAVAPYDGDKYPDDDTQSDYEDYERGDDDDEVAPFGDREDEYHDDKVSVCSSDSSSDLS